LCNRIIIHHNSNIPKFRNSQCACCPQPLERYCDKCNAGYCAECCDRVHKNKVFASHTPIEAGGQNDHCALHPGVSPVSYCTECREMLYSL
ncbi:hypothetical protein KIPB_014757, partial [Kipferlia bialata]